MNNRLKLFGYSFLLMFAFSACTSINKTMREPNSRVELKKEDFSFTPNQVAAEANSTKIFGIDFARIFTKKTGSVEGAFNISFASIPIVGNFIADRTANYALYNLMNDNPGYDVVFYPQYETKVIKPILGLGFIVKSTNVKVKARLGKLNAN